MNALAAFVAGLVFGIGLLVSGMSNPAKVLGFLDLAGRWDSSLLLVMAGAIPVVAVAHRVASERATTVLSGPIDIPARRNIDARLVAGGVIFGVGWGLVGLCPAPALLTVGAGRAQGALFSLAMLAAMAMFAIAQRMRDRAQSAPATGDA